MMAGVVGEIACQARRSALGGADQAVIVVDPALIAQARRLLNQARMIAEPAAAQSTQIGHGHPDSQMPPGLAFSKAGAIYRTRVTTLEACGDRINRAIATGSDSELERANRWCEEEMKSLQHAAARGPETPLEFRARVCAQYEGILAGVVARLEMTSVTTVRKFRVEAGRDARTGRKVEGVGEGGGAGDGS